MKYVATVLTEMSYQNQALSFKFQTGHIMLHCISLCIVHTEVAVPITSGETVTCECNRVHMYILITTGTGVQESSLVWQLERGYGSIGR